MATEYHRVDCADHLLLNELVLIDRDVPHAGYALHIDILQCATEILGPGDGFADPTRDVEIDIAIGVARQLRAERRIKSNRQLHGHPELTQTRHHVRQDRRTRRVPDQNNGSHSAAFVFGSGFFRERGP